MKYNSTNAAIIMEVLRSDARPQTYRHVAELTDFDVDYVETAIRHFTNLSIQLNRNVEYQAANMSNIIHATWYRNHEKI